MAVNSKERWWTIVQAIAWIVCRDDRAVSALKGCLTIRHLSRKGLVPAEIGELAPLPLSAAPNAFGTEFRQGRIELWGYPRQSHQLAKIPPYPGLTIEDTDHGMQAKVFVSYSPEETVWTHLLVERVECQKLWPALHEGAVDSNSKVDDSLVQAIGPRLFREEWIATLTAEERWLLEEAERRPRAVRPERLIGDRSAQVAHAQDAQRAMGMPVGAVWLESDLISQEKVSAAMHRRGLMLHLHEQARGWLKDRAISNTSELERVLIAEPDTVGPPVPTPAPSTRKPTDLEMSRWMLERQASLKAAGKRHGRDVVLSAAREHFGVSHKVILGVWNSR